MFGLDTLVDLIVKPIIGSIKEYVIKHLLYIVQVGGHVKALTRESEILQGKLKDVEDQIERDESAQKRPTHEVQVWLDRVKDLLPRVDSVLSDYDKRICMCLGCFSLNCCASHSISSRALEELQNVEDEKKFIGDITTYTAEPVPSAVQLVSTTALTTAAGEIEAKLKIALDFLEDDSRGVLGIWGMGGVGKTTLLNHINNELAKGESSGRFDRVILVTASRNCTTEKIQELIVENLGLPKGGNLNNIFNYLNHKSFVILLDDVWERLNLQEVGIPLPFGVDGQIKRKLILASRSQQVCHRMDAINSTIRVECLSRNAARLLFREKAGIEAVNCDQHMLDLVDRVADECGGLPQALITIGSAMAGVADIQVWESALNDLQKSKTYEITGTDDDPLPLLKISYDYLRDETKQKCLLHCALWPEDHIIPKHELIRCWMGHGLLGEFEDIQMAYSKGHAIIDGLQKACLLEHVEFNSAHIGLYGYYEFVRLHDLVRDMALWIARDWVVLAGTELEEVPSSFYSWGEASKISLSHNKISVLPTKIDYKYSNLVTLMLQFNYTLWRAKFKMLNYFPSLKYLDLSWCGLIGDAPIEICQLSMLEYLDLSDNEIMSLPYQFKSLRKLKYLLVSDNLISSLPDGLFSDMDSLLVLDLSHNRLPTSDMDHLECLEGRVRALGVDADLQGLQKLALLSRIPIRSLQLKSIEQPALELLSPNCLGRKHMYSNLRDLNMESCGFEVLEIGRGHCFSSLDKLSLDTASELREIMWKAVGPANVFPKLTLLFINNCPLIEHVTWAVELPCLNIMVVEECENLEHLVLWEKITNNEYKSAAFRRLQYLELRSLNELTSICDGELTFPSLEFLRIYYCQQFTKFPSASLESCTKLKQIMGISQWWDSLDLEDDTKNKFQPLFIENRF